MKVACLMPTYNRYPKVGYVVEEAVESFLRQDHPDRELIIHNDNPEQRLIFDHPMVRVINTEFRFPDLSSKIQFMIDNASKDCEAFARWDDDDIHLPWRLSMCLHRMREQGRVEWRASNHWFDPGKLSETLRPANNHVHSVWTRRCLELIGGKYPEKFSGYEDQAFNQALRKAKLPDGEIVPRLDIYYLYRWGTGGIHLSGPGGDAANLQRHYELIGKKKVTQTGDIIIQPRWRSDHVERAQIAATA